MNTMLNASSIENKDLEITRLKGIAIFVYVLIHTSGPVLN